MRLCGRRFGYLQGVVFMKNFRISKLFWKYHFDVCSKQTYAEKFKHFLRTGLHECWKHFVFLLVKWSVVWLVKRVQTSICGF
jgi:hypothetical protein